MHKGEPVIFRMELDGHLIALFPCDPWSADTSKTFAVSELDGEVGVRYDLVMGQTRAAKPSEYRHFQAQVEEQFGLVRPTARRTGTQAAEFIRRYKEMFTRMHEVTHQGFLDDPSTLIICHDCARALHGDSWIDATISVGTVNLATCERCGRPLPSVAPNTVMRLAMRPDASGHHVQA